MYYKLSGKLMTRTGLFVTVFMIQMITVPLFHIPVMTDAINPLAFGFMARGDDWSRYLAADGYYYKYGQLLFYFPFIYLIRDNVILYRVLLTVNALLVSCIALCAYEILTRHFKSTDKENNFFISLLTAVSPIITLNSKYTWAEPVLMLLPWILLLLLLNSMEDEYSRKKKYVYSIAIAVVQVYAYMVHTRGLVILIASVICVCLMRVICHNKNISMIMYFIVTLLLLFTDRKVGSILNRILYGGSEELVGATASFLTREFVEKLFSAEGLKVWAGETLGWLFASVAGTFGLVSLGFVASGMIGLRGWRNHSRQEWLVALFTGLLFIGSLVLGTVFFFEDLFAVSGIEITKRGDKLIYARYINGAGILFSFIGLYFFLLREKVWTAARIFCAAAIFMVLNGFFASAIAERIDNTITWITNIVTINYFCDYAECVRGGAYSTVGFLSGGIAFFGLASFAVFLTAVFNRKKSKVFCLIYLLVFLTGYLLNSYNVLHRPDAYMMNMIDEYSDVIRSVQGEAELTNIYLDDEVLRTGFQYYFSDYYILTKRDDNRNNVKNMFVISDKDACNQDLFDDDYFVIEGMQDKDLDCHLYIKGEALNEELNKMGYVTQRILRVG